MSAEVVPLYAYETALTVIQALMVEYQNAVTALAEAKPDSADELGAHLAEVFGSVHAALATSGL